MVRIRRRTRNWIIAGGVVLIVAIAAAAALLPTALDRVREFRAEALYEQSLEATEAGNHREAFERAVSAANMRPSEGRMVRQAARAALDYGHISMGEWWQRAMEFPELDVDPSVAFARMLFEQGAVNEAHRLLERLAEIDPEHAEVAAMRIRSLRILRRFGEARRLGESFLARDPAAADVEVEYLEALLSIPSQDAREAALRRLVNWADPATETPGLTLLRRAVRVDGIDESLRASLVDRLHTHPDATRNDQLFARAIQVRLGLMDWDDVSEEIRGAFDLSDAAEKAELMAWMNSFGLQDQVRRDFSLAQVRNDEAQMQAYLGAMVTGDRSDLRRLVELTFEPSDSLPLPLADILMWRARALIELGEGEEARSTLRRGVDVVELNRFRSFETFLLQYSEWEILKSLYRRLMDSSMTRALGERRLLMAHYQLGEEDAVLSMLEDGDFRMERADASFLGFVGYLNIIYRSELSSRGQLESLVADYPGVADFRILLAMDYALHDRESVARELLAGLPELPPGAPRHVLFARVFLTGRLGMGDEHLSEIALRLTTADLLPRERQLLHAVRSR